MDENRKTLSWLYILMLILVVISIILEFNVIEKIIHWYIGDSEVEKFPKLLAVLAHLNSHGEFYENIALGGLASAVISAVTIQVAVNERKRNNMIVFSNAVQDMVVSYAGLMEGLENFNHLEANTKYFINKMNDFKAQCKKYNEAADEWNELIKMCDETFDPMTKKIQSFITSLKKSPWFEDRSFIDWYGEGAYNTAMEKIKNTLYESLDKQFSFENIMEQLNKIYSMTDTINQYYLKRVRGTIGMMIKNMEERDQAYDMLRYAHMIERCFSAVIEEYDEKRKEIKKGEEEKKE